MSIADHRPHVPWGGVAAIIRRRHEDGGEPTLVLSDTSIHEWLAQGDRVPPAAELVPARPADEPTALLPALSPSAPMLPPARRQVTVWRSPAAREQTGRDLDAHRMRVHVVADRLARENDERMSVLLERSARAVHTSSLRAHWCDELWTKSVFRRRRERIRALVPELGRLLELGDVDQATAARVMSLRARYLSASDEESQRLPRLTPELLAAMDVERAKAGTAVAS
jgi:hypothetical protein